MNRVLEIQDQQPYFIFQSPPPPIPSTHYSSSGFNLNNKVSPSVLLIIIIIAIIFFISGLLHLLVRFLLRPPNRDPDEMENVTALQGQLQQLFHLHDSGVDQSFIDTLPIFNYKAIIGVKDPFDCAVCLCEFEGEDKLRLLPKCSHAFHMDCIDTWLLSHSTCPLCRASLLLEFGPNNTNCSPIVLVLESRGESSREIVADREVARVNSQLGSYRDDEDGDESKLHHADLPQDTCENHEDKKLILGSGEKVVSVKLGKFKNLDNVSECGGASSSESNADARRCFSMGSFAYVMDENLSLQVPIRNTPVRRQCSKKPSIPLTPGHRQAMSECGFDSRVEFNGFEAFRILESQGGEKGTGVVSHGNGNKSIGKSKRESFSVSKIWLRDRKDKPNGVAIDSSRRAVSFRFPVHRNSVGGADEFKSKNSGGCGRTISEIGISRWRNGGEDEIQSCNSLDSETSAPSFARRTLLWLMGRQNKVVHSSFSNNV